LKEIAKALAKHAVTQHGKRESEAPSQDKHGEM